MAAVAEAAARVGAACPGVAEATHEELAAFLRAEAATLEVAVVTLAAATLGVMEATHAAAAMRVAAAVII